VGNSEQELPGGVKAHRYEPTNEKVFGIGHGAFSERPRSLVPRE
jgi:hypothetical protein